jgi:hypothetical protein
VAAGLKAEQWREAMFTDGQFRRPAGGGTLDVRDKASGEIFAPRSAASASPAWAAGRVAMPTSRNSPSGAG